MLKDLKVFLRDTTQWSQLLLLVALALVYLYNFRVLDLERVPYMSGVVKNAYAFVNLAMAAFVLSAVAVRFVFPAVSAEGAAFWVVRTAPVPLRSFLWSKFWIGLVPVVLLAEVLTVAANEFLGAAPFLKMLCALAVLFMTWRSSALAAGMGARYPRFAAENLTQVAGLVRRHRVHGAGGALHHGGDHPAGVAVVPLPLVPVRGCAHLAAGLDSHEPLGRGGVRAQPGRGLPALRDGIESLEALRG